MFPKGYFAPVYFTEVYWLPVIIIEGEGYLFVMLWGD
jgi:hypothetical protein